METEVWKPLKTHPDLMVSSHGRVMTVPYFGSMPRGGERAYGGIPTFGVWNKQDSRFQHWHHGAVYKVARLVCEGFHGLPSDGQVCIHIDENSMNNRADNLRWGTQKENLNCPKFIAYCKTRTGDNNPYMKGRKSETLLQRVR